MHIAGFYAHPDDLELWAGGTVLHHLKLADRVTSLVFYECPERRLAEMEAARMHLPVEDFVYITPAFTPIAPDAWAMLLDDVPDVVLTHWNRDAHKEHRLVFEHARHFCQLAKRRCRKTPVLLMSSTYYLRGESETFEPGIIIDITAVAASKADAIRCHESQHPEQLLADVLSQNRIFGGRTGVEYAEGFKEYPLFGFTRTVLRSSLSDVLQWR
jgi:N-acetylglucosamine malate deacetylase 1